ncbi:hypothetical protein Tco_0954567 [Tanacetum coccineum]|uniref:Reverse transcriptase domain-containing protein n=1 Tax=Tanacetum coccineum TaxID=301880 RepID=A0ABQ5E4Q8_9ASTR
MVGANHAAYTNRFHELAKLVPHLVTPESAHIKRYVAGLAPEIKGMLKATQPTTIHNAILRADILTDEAISCGTLSKSNKKRKVVELISKSGRSWKENKKEKVGTGFMATSPLRNEFVGSNSRPVAPESAVRMGNNPRGNRNTRSNGNQVSGRAFNVNVNAMEAIWDPNVVTGTFSLNDHFVSGLVPRYGYVKYWQEIRLDTIDWTAANDALDSAAGGILGQMPQEGLAIIESKSKVRYSRSRANDSRVSTDAPLSNSSPSNNSFDMQQIAASLEDKMTIKMNKMLNEMKALVVTIPAQSSSCRCAV